MNRDQYQAKVKREGEGVKRMKEWQDSAASNPRVMVLYPNYNLLQAFMKFAFLFV